MGDGGFGWVWWFSGCLLSVWTWWSVVGDLVFMSDGGWLHLGFPGLLDFVGIVICFLADFWVWGLVCWWFGLCCFGLCLMGFWSVCFVWSLGWC